MSNSSESSSESINKPQIECYVVNLLNQDIFTFKTVPESVSESNSASFEAVSPKGRSNHYQGYDASGSRTVSVEFRVHEDDFGKGGNIRKEVAKLRALLYPSYSSGMVDAPKGYLRVGDTIGMKCIFPTISVNWELPVREGRYINALINIEAIETKEDDPWGVDEIFGDRDFV